MISTFRIFRRIRVKKFLGFFFAQLDARPPLWCALRQTFPPSTFQI